MTKSTKIDSLKQSSIIENKKIEISLSPVPLNLSFSSNGQFLGCFIDDKKDQVISYHKKI